MDSAYRLWSLGSLKGFWKADDRVPPAARTLLPILSSSMNYFSAIFWISTIGGRLRKGIERRTLAEQ